MAEFDIYAGLRTFLVSDPSSWGALSAGDQARRIAARVAIQSLVGPRIYPEKLPQTVAYPAVKIFMVSGRRTGILNGPALYAKPVFQIDCYNRESSATAAFDNLVTLADAIMERLNGYYGLFTDASASPAQTVHVGVNHEDTRDLPFDPDAVGGIYHRALEFRIGYSSRVS